MQSNTQLWTTLENLRYNHRAHSGWIVIRSQYKNCPFGQTTPLWTEWMLTKTCTSKCSCRALLKLSKWFGGLWLTKTLNRASEYLTDPWQDPAVRYCRGICQALHGTDYSHQEVKRLVWCSFEVDAEALCALWLHCDQVQRSVLYLHVNLDNKSLRWSALQWWNMWCFCSCCILLS